MSDAAVLIPNLDAMPAAPPAAGAAPGAPPNTAPGGEFAGMLSARLQTPADPNAPLQTPAAAGALPPPAGGAVWPPAGNTLPLPPAAAPPADAGEGLPPWLGGEDVLQATDATLASPLLSAAAPMTPTPTTEEIGAGLEKQADPGEAASGLLPPGPVPVAPATLDFSTAASAPAGNPAAVAVSSAATAAATNPAAAAPAPAPTAEQEMPLPDWFNLRMAKAAADGKPSAVVSAAATNPPQGTDALTPMAYQQLLGMRPAMAGGQNPLAGVMGTGVTKRVQMEQALALNTVSGTEHTPADSDAGVVGGMGMPRTTPMATPAAVPSVSVATPFGQPDWSQELGQRVAWLANREIREAQIQLNPRHLGPVEIRIAYGHEQQVNVSFVAHHPQAREALDAALPRLREMFDNQGLNLADASVSQESFTERRHSGDTASANGGGRGSGGRLAEGELPEEMPPPVIQKLGLLDAYA
jgi:flagellar hook-length control protein FliK